jgi:putative oxidoreductase
MLLLLTGLLSLIQKCQETLEDIMFDQTLLQTKLTPRMLSILRIITGFLFMQHGAQKVFGWLGAQQPPPLFSFMGFAGALEFFGGLFILLGLLTRPVAFLLSGQMAVAYFMVHAKNGFWR